MIFIFIKFWRFKSSEIDFIMKAVSKHRDLFYFRLINIKYAKHHVIYNLLKIISGISSKPLKAENLVGFRNHS